MTKEELLSQEGFTEDQKKQAVFGFKVGLTVWQVTFFYNPEFTWRQMRQAVIGFKNGLTTVQVSSYYKQEIDEFDMLVYRMQTQRENP